MSLLTSQLSASRFVPSRHDYSLLHAPGQSVSTGQIKSVRVTPTIQISLGHIDPTRLVRSRRFLRHFLTALLASLPVRPARPRQVTSYRTDPDYPRLLWSNQVRLLNSLPLGALQYDYSDLFDTCQLRLAMPSLAEALLRIPTSLPDASTIPTVSNPTSQYRSQHFLSCPTIRTGSALVATVRQVASTPRPCSPDSCPTTRIASFPFASTAHAGFESFLYPSIRQVASHLLGADRFDYPIPCNFRAVRLDYPGHVLTSQVRSDYPIRGLPRRSRVGSVPTCRVLSLLSRSHRQSTSVRTILIPLRLSARGSDQLKSFRQVPPGRHESLPFDTIHSTVRPISNRFRPLPTTRPLPLLALTDRFRLPRSGLSHCCPSPTTRIRPMPIRLAVPLLAVPNPTSRPSVSSPPGWVTLRVLEGALGIALVVWRVG